MSLDANAAAGAEGEVGSTGDGLGNNNVPPPPARGGRGRGGGRGIGAPRGQGRGGRGGAGGGRGRAPRRRAGADTAANDDNRRGRETRGRGRTAEDAAAFADFAAFSAAIRRNRPPPQVEPVDVAIAHLVVRLSTDASRIPDHHLLLPPNGHVVEYEWTKGPRTGGGDDVDNIFAGLTDEQAEKLVTLFATDRDVLSDWEMWRVLWLSESCYLCNRDPMDDVVDRVTLFGSLTYPNLFRPVEVVLRGIDPRSGGDALLNLLGKSRNVLRYEFSVVSRSRIFPFTEAGLHAFLEKIHIGSRPKYWKSRRGNLPPCEASGSNTSVTFASTHRRPGFLSEDQKRVLACGGHRRIHLEVSHAWMSGDGVQLLTEGIRRGLSPAQLSFHACFLFPTSQLDDLVDAIRSSTLESIDSCLPCSLATRALSQNRGLRRVHLEHSHIPPNELEAFWTAAASHPTLQVVELTITEAHLKRMADILPSSLSLQHVYLHDEPNIFPVIPTFVEVRAAPPGAPAPPFQLHSWTDNWLEWRPLLLDRLLPTLVLNRFRSVVATIMNVPDPAARFRAVWSALVDDGMVRNTPSLAFHLLTSAPNIFVEGLERRHRRRISAVAEASAQPILPCERKRPAPSAW